ncbi:MAG: hypothetical protein VXY27_02490, partial [Thermoproteota archaeon]|nr:hypothetical protein [Thermoproteota archaeon]
MIIFRLFSCSRVITNRAKLRLKIPKKYNIPFSANNITGFPTETKKLAFDTIELNRQIDADNANIYAF